VGFGWRVGSVVGRGLRLQDGARGVELRALLTWRLDATLRTVEDDVLADAGLMHCSIRVSLAASRCGRTVKAGAGEEQLEHLRSARAVRDTGVAWTQWMFQS
jgi:hypothetical protein